MFRLFFALGLGFYFSVKISVDIVCGKDHFFFVQFTFIVVRV